jgi:hypothetical protein
MQKSGTFPTFWVISNDFSFQYSGKQSLPIDSICPWKIIDERKNNNQRNYPILLSEKWISFVDFPFSLKNIS